jgi:hypothetical protein
MAVFPILEIEPIVQIGDKTRLNALKSFIAPQDGTFDLVRIKPTASAQYITVSETDRHLDWVYSASGVVTVSLLVIKNCPYASGEIEKNITVVTAEQDNLFSTDEDLRLHEPEILKWVVDGRSSFLDMHRRAQVLIMKWLDKEGYVDVYGNPFTKAAIVDVEEVKAWSTFLVLKLIFEGLSNATDDIFHEKAKRYNGKMQEYRKKALLRIDVDGDGNAENFEGITPAFGFVARR